MIKRFLIAFISVLGIHATAQAAVLTVDCAGGPFTTISAAVMAAANGDTIVVHPCATGYNENVVINNFDDLHLVAADATIAPAVVGSYATGIDLVTTPEVIIDGTGLNGDCISVAGGNRSVSITGFWLRKCNSGISIFQSSDTVAHGNRIQDMSFAAIFDSGTDGTVVSGNIMGLNPYGIYIEASREPRLLDNWLLYHDKNGIFLAGDRIQVTNNRVQDSGSDGILSQFGSQHRIERNTVSNSGGSANILISAGVTGVDVIGNDTAGSLVDMAGSDLAENL